MTPTSPRARRLVSILSVVVPVVAIACGSSSSSTSSTTDAYAEARQHCVATINSYRATLSLPPYAAWDDAPTNACIDGQAKADAASNTAHSAFGHCQESAQDECPGWPGPPDSLLDGCLAAMWAEGPGTDFSQHGHYLNMSSTKYTKAACGFFETADGNYWAAQNFK
jgi:hypothetical protein